jgi:outer membrane protein OmpA-like peptidoglycan-associated protein
VSAFLDLDSLSTYKELTQDLSLVPMELGQIVRLNNIFFDFAKSTLEPESEPELRRVAELLRSNPNMCLEIDGHTDDVGSAEDNLRLSKDRAAAVTGFLESLGIGKERLVADGFGEARPVSGNEDERGRSMNRRVEFKIIRL